jgi:hypothetical protein
VTPKPRSGWHRASPPRLLLAVLHAGSSGLRVGTRSDCVLPPFAARPPSVAAEPQTPAPRCLAGYSLRGRTRLPVGPEPHRSPRVRGRKILAHGSADFGRTCGRKSPATSVRGRPLIAAEASLSPFRRQRPRRGEFPPHTKKGGQGGLTERKCKGGAHLHTSQKKGGRGV